MYLYDDYIESCKAVAKLAVKYRNAVSNRASYQYCSDLIREMRVKMLESAQLFKQVRAEHEELLKRHLK